MPGWIVFSLVFLFGVAVGAFLLSLLVAAADAHEGELS